MAFLEIAGQRLVVPPGDSVIGSDPSAAVRLEGSGVTARHALLHADQDGQVAVRRADEGGEIQINGVRLGPQPTPLLHGDKIEIAGHELLYVDERRSGSTMYVQAVDPSAFAARKATSEHAPTAATGGRLVSLTDGREYTVAGASLVMGREAGCDVVVTSKAVSRRHAEIVVTPKGYVVIDSSTNGTFVNGKRIDGQRLLARADVLRIGDHDFRFYADLVKPDSPPPAAASPPPEGAAMRLADTLHGVPGVARSSGPSSPPVSPAPAASPPATPAPPAAAAARTSGGGARASGGGGPLAYVVIRSGMLKGQRLPIRVPVVNVGRAEYNDLVLPDDSVSTVHAKFQRREGIWMLVDLDSTNGTFVDGEKVAGEAPLAPGALVRFGEVRGFFEPADDDQPEMGGSTKLISAIKMPLDK